MKSVYLQKGFKAYFHEDERSFSRSCLSLGAESAAQGGQESRGVGGDAKAAGKVSCRCSLRAQFSLILKCVWRKEVTSFPNRPLHLLLRFHLCLHRVTCSVSKVMFSALLFIITKFIESIPVLIICERSPDLD